MRFAILCRELALSKEEAQALVKSAALAFPQWLTGLKGMDRGALMAAYMMGRNAGITYAQARELIGYC